MDINSKIFYEFILSGGIKSHNCVYGYALFSFWKYIIIIIIIIIIIFPVRCLSLVLNYTIIIFHCKFPLDLFSTCIITPVYFFDILRLLIPLYPPNTTILSCIFIPFQELVSNIKRGYTNWALLSRIKWQLKIRKKKCFMKK